MSETPGSAVAPGNTEIRAIDDSELDVWLRALDASFLMPTPGGGAAFYQEFYRPGRALGAFSAGRCVGTSRSLDLELTVPGGAVVLVEGITNVAVIPDHRRRGLLSRMMCVGLDDAVGRGRSLPRVERTGGPPLPQRRWGSGWNGALSGRREMAARRRGLRADGT